MRFVRYIRHRLNERSTWVSFVAGIGGASALPAPWSYMAMAAGAIGALVPDGDIAGPNQ